MRMPLVVAGLAVGVLVLGACGGGSGTTASDPGGGSAMPTTVPAAPGDVRTRGLATVMDEGRPELCLGPVAESWPPQCSGPPLAGWDWRRQRLVPGRSAGSTFEQQGAVRWGQYALTGRWDGTTFTVLTAVPGALYDAAPEEPSIPPGRDHNRPAAELEQIARTLMDELPGALSSYVQDGRVVVDVVYDDGSLQAWADAEYGAGVVVVESMLLDLEPA